MQELRYILKRLRSAGTDLLPIVLVIAFFQIVIIRQPLPNLGEILAGTVIVIIGLSMFIEGLESALFPLGENMAQALTRKGSLFWLLVFSFALGFSTTVAEPALIAIAGEAADIAAGGGVAWQDYGWVYLFAAMTGFATTIAEPSLIAVAYKARAVSGGSINEWGLRITVAIGVAFGISLGAFRIVTGTPLYLYILVGYIIVIIQTFFAPRTIMAIAYDSGGVTTSTVTVPIVAALGLGLATAVPGRDPAIDGFGLIAFASLFPIIAVLGYGQYAAWSSSRALTRSKEKHNEIQSHTRIG